MATKQSSPKRKVNTQKAKVYVESVLAKKKRGENFPNNYESRLVKLSCS